MRTRQEILKLSLCFQVLRRAISSSSNLSHSLFGLSLSCSKSLVIDVGLVLNCGELGTGSPVLRKERWKYHVGPSGVQVCPAEETSHEGIGTYG